VYFEVPSKLINCILLVRPGSHSSSHDYSSSSHSVVAGAGAGGGHRRCLRCINSSHNRKVLTCRWEHLSH